MGMSRDTSSLATYEEDHEEKDSENPKPFLSSHEDPVTRNYDPTEGKAVYGPMLTQSEFKLQVQNCLQEYINWCDTDEVIRSIEELQCTEYHRDIVKKAISIDQTVGVQWQERWYNLLGEYASRNLGLNSGVGRKMEGAILPGTTQVDTKYRTVSS
jgi:hypothetical protein